VQSCIIYFFFSFYSKKTYVYVNFYYKFILINKFIEHNQVNDLYYDIKYNDFFKIFLFIIDDFFLKFIYTMVLDLFNYMHA